MFTKLLERSLLYIDGHPVFSAVLGLSLILTIVALISPLFLPVPIPLETKSLVISHPLTVLPGKSYTITIRSKDPNTTFTVTESGTFATITEIIDLEGSTPRQRINFDVSSPYPRDLEVHYASFEVLTTDSAQNVEVTTFRCTIDTISLPIRLFFSLILSAPAFQIFWHRIGRKPQ